MPHVAESGDLGVHLPAGVVTGRARDQAVLTVRDCVSSTCRALGLATEPRTEVVWGSGERVAELYLDGKPLPVSTRRRCQVAVTTSGRPHQSSDPPYSEEFVLERAQSGDVDERCALLAALTKAGLHATASTLVASQAQKIAAARLGDADTGDITRAAQILELTAQLRVVPAQIETSVLAKAAALKDTDPYHACEQVLSSATQSDQLSPVLEFSRATLRRLTSSESSPAAGPATGAGSWGGSRGIRQECRNGYGVFLPPFRLAVVSDIAADRFRVRFGSSRTPDHLVLPTAHLAVFETPTADGADSGMSYLDQLHGGILPILSMTPSSHMSLPATSGFDHAALAIREIYSELRPRLAWWAPQTLPGIDAFSGDLAARLSSRVAVVLRWLVADGATVFHEGPIIEGMLTSLGDGEPAVQDTIRSTREHLRAAVLGPVPVYDSPHAIDLDDQAVAEAGQSDSAAPLLERHPALVQSIRTVVAICSPDARATVQRLLRSLGDVVLVASTAEVHGTVLQVSSQTLQGAT